MSPRAQQSGMNRQIGSGRAGLALKGSMSRALPYRPRSMRSPERISTTRPEQSPIDGGPESIAIAGQLLQGVGARRGCPPPGTRSTPSARHSGTPGVSDEIGLLNQQQRVRLRTPFRKFLPRDPLDLGPVLAEQGAKLAARGFSNLSYG